MTQTVETRRMNGHDEEETGMIRRPTTEGSMAIATTRASQEVQAAMVIAKRFPRDETAAVQRILQACKRRGLAEAAVYSFPRGNTTVEGPSIRLAEAMAQSWGNVDFGIVELEQKNGESQVMAYAWDLETNTRQTKIFAVPHKRHTKNGDYKLTDPRDIYEMVANNGARRLRACILGIIPGDVQDAALAECNKTLTSGAKEPLIDRVRSAIAAFAELGVSQAMIESRLQHKADTINEAELLGLRKIYRSLTDGMAKREEFFDVGAGQADTGGTRTEKLAETLKQQATAQADTAASPKSGRPGPKKAAEQPATADEPAQHEDPPAESDEAPAFEAILAEATEWAEQRDITTLRNFIVGHKKPAWKKKAMETAGVTTVMEKECKDEDVRAVAANLRALELQDGKGA